MLFFFLSFSFYFLHSKLSSMFYKLFWLFFSFLKCSDKFFTLANFSFFPISLVVSQSLLMTFSLTFFYYLLLTPYSAWLEKKSIVYMGGPRFAQNTKPSLDFYCNVPTRVQVCCFRRPCHWKTFCKRDLGLSPHENVQCFDFRCAVELSSLIHLEFSSKVEGVFFMSFVG